MAVTHYRELIAWQRAMDLSLAIYQETQSFPADERFGLTNQLRRASVSIPSNIAEGQGRGSAKEFCQFLRIAIGSLQECETQIILAARLGYLEDATTQRLFDQADEVGRITNGLIRSLLATGH